jgi:hypothetical protein
MAKKKKRAKYKRRKSSYIPAGRKGHVKRGCGKRNWKRGNNAYWGCKKGRQRKYSKKKARSRKR